MLFIHRQQAKHFSQLGEVRSLGAALKAGRYLLTTWKMFADDICSLSGPGHAGVNQNIVLQSQCS